MIQERWESIIGAWQLFGAKIENTDFLMLEIMISDPLLILSVGYSNQKGSLREKEEYKPDLRDILQWI